MPLDNSLFRDFRTCFDMHVTLTSILPCTDPRRFSKGTPKSISSSISRIWDPVTGVSPPPNRIIQDITRMTENIMLVIEAGVAIVPGVCDRNGHRRKQREGVPDRRGRYNWSKINKEEEAKALDTVRIRVLICYFCVRYKSSRVNIICAEISKTRYHQKGGYESTQNILHYNSLFYIKSN